jgi:hypothetical protein
LVTSSMSDRQQELEKKQQLGAHCRIVNLTPNNRSSIRCEVIVGGEITFSFSCFLTSSPAVLFFLWLRRRPTLLEGQYVVTSLLATNSGAW